MTASLDDVLKELKKIKNELVVNSALSFLSDVTAIPKTTTTENAATIAGALIQFKTPNVWVDMATLAVAVDSNTSTNYKWSLKIDQIEQLDNVNYKQFLTQTFNFVEGLKVRLPPYTTISFNAYNYNSATSDGNVVLFFLGDKINRNED